MAANDDIFSAAVNAAKGPLGKLTAAYDWMMTHWSTVLIWGAWGALALGIGVGIFIGLIYVRRRLVNWLRNKNTKLTTWRVVAADVIGRTSGFFIATISLLVALTAIGISDPFLDIIFAGAIFLQAGIWATIFLSRAITSYAERRTADRVALINAMSLVQVLVHVVVWSIVLTVFLSNLGMDVTAMIAGLGIGGVAIGLAAQGIFADLFASLSIVLDKPFVRGDFIVGDSLLGKVEKIGMKSTRIRSLSGEQVVVSNANLLNSTIHNYQRMQERRVLFSLGIAYHTPFDKVNKTPGLIRDAIEATPNTRFDRAHFLTYGDSSLVFEIVYFVLDPDYNKYMDTQQAINFGIMRRFEEEGIQFAFPTRTIYVANTDGTPLPQRNKLAHAS